MDRQAIRERQVIERYLQGTLTAEEEQAFEEAYLADSELLDELVLTEKLREGVRRQAGHREGSPSAPPAARRTAWRSLLGSPRYAAAASVLLGISLLGSGALLVENQRLRAGGRPAAGTPTRVLPLVAVRGERPNLVPAPAPNEWTVFLLDPGFADFDTYRATLARRGAGASEQLLRLDDLEPNYEGLLPLGLPGRLLTPGRYEILLEGRKAGATGYEPVTRLAVNVAARP